MSSSPDTAQLLRGASAGSATPYAVGADLRGAAARRRLLDPVVQQELDAARAAAEAAGYAAGWAAGQHAARAAAEAEMEAWRAQAAAVAAQHAARLGQAVAAVERGASALERAAAPVAAECDAALAAAAVELAEALLGRELALTADPVMDGVRRALSLAPNGRPVTLRVHPDDASTLASDDLAGTGRVITVVADPTVEPGGCVAECDATRINAQLGTALDRVRETLA
jgi:flagellar assembly protein FliH